MVAFGFIACGGEPGPSPDTCSGAESLPEAGARLRATLEYVDRATLPERACHLCLQYAAAQADAFCGSCKLVPGPIHPNGSCKVFAAKVA